MLSPDRTPSPQVRESDAVRARADTACFSITALPAPGTLPRLLNAFAQRSLIPERWHGVLTADGELQVDVQVAGMEMDVAELVAAKLRSLIDVRTVLLFQKI